MIRPPASDFWQVGIVPAPIASLLRPGALGAHKNDTFWLQEPDPWRYLADPFGVRRKDATHVFVEAFDYRTKHAVIEHHEFDHNLVWQNKSTVLARPFHLSYPYLIESDGETFMIPESHQAGEIALYRATEFPRQWVRETALLPDVRGAEASVIRHGAYWWMFFTIVGPGARDQRELHVAYAEALTGPWRLHPGNPIIDDRAGGRPGGTPFVGGDGLVFLPVQDCSQTYGGAISFVRFIKLEPGHIEIDRPDVRLTGADLSPSHPDGCHTFASCGDLTLIDTKRIVRSWSRYKIDFQRRLRRLRARRPA